VGYTLLALYLSAVFTGAQNTVQLKPITVSAAISLTDALTAVARAYADTGGAVRFNFGASNVLARQIVNGAPVDVFISADEAQMDVVGAAGLLQNGSRVNLLRNQLAVAVPSDRPRIFTSIRELTDPAYKRIAVGDPAAVPAGVYAKQYLEKEGLWDAIQGRLVPTVSVRAALAAVESGAADAAIVYHTDVRISLRATVAWVVPADRGPRILYPAAIVRTTTLPDESKRFVDFLLGDAAARIFERFGFSPVSASTPRLAPRRGEVRLCSSYGGARLRSSYGEAGLRRGYGAGPLK
jgi:molybdate transport system substrate-binding protein